MNDIKLTEQAVIDKLVARAKVAGEVAPRVVVISRIQPPKGAMRTVRFALITSINNEALIEELVSECISNNNNFYFVGSEVNLQGDLDMDYLMFEASIFVKRN